MFSKLFLVLHFSWINLVAAVRDFISLSVLPPMTPSRHFIDQRKLSRIHTLRQLLHIMQKYSSHRLSVALRKPLKDKNFTLIEAPNLGPQSNQNWNNLIWSVNLGHEFLFNIVKFWTNLLSKTGGGAFANLYGPVIPKIRPVPLIS